MDADTSPKRNFPQSVFEMPGEDGKDPTHALMMDWVGDYFNLKKIRQAEPFSAPPSGPPMMVQRESIPNTTKGKGKSKGKGGCEPCRDRRLLQTWLKIRWVGMPWPKRLWRALRHGEAIHSRPGCGCVWKLRMGVYLFKQFLVAWKKQ